MDKHSLVVYKDRESTLYLLKRIFVRLYVYFCNSVISGYINEDKIIKSHRHSALNIRKALAVTSCITLIFVSFYNFDVNLLNYWIFIAIGALTFAMSIVLVYLTPTLIRNYLIVFFFVYTFPLESSDTQSKENLETTKQTQEYTEDSELFKDLTIDKLLEDVFIDEIDAILVLEEVLEKVSEYNPGVYLKEEYNISFITENGQVAMLDVSEGIDNLLKEIILDNPGYNLNFNAIIGDVELLDASYMICDKSNQSCTPVSKQEYFEYLDSLFKGLKI